MWVNYVRLGMYWEMGIRLKQNRLPRAHVDKTWTNFVEKEKKVTVRSEELWL